MTDFKRLRRIPIGNVVRALGLKMNMKGKTLRGPCPICRGPSQRAFTCTPHLGRFYCFQCKKNGDPLQLVMEVKHLEHKEAAQWLMDTFKPP